MIRGCRLFILSPSYRQTLTRLLCVQRPNVGSLISRPSLILRLDMKSKSAPQPNSVRRRKRSMTRHSRNWRLATTQLPFLALVGPRTSPWNSSRRSPLTSRSIERRRSTPCFYSTRPPKLLTIYPLRSTRSKGGWILWTGLLHARANYNYSGVGSVAARAGRIYAEQNPPDLPGFSSALNSEALALEDEIDRQKRSRSMSGPLRSGKRRWGPSAPTWPIASTAGLGSTKLEAIRES
jgi:hypothetical protein